MGKYAQVRRTRIKVQVQGLTANGDSLEIRLIVLFGIGGHSAIIGASSSRSSSVDARWSGCTHFGVLAINACQCNGTGYLLAWELGCTLGDGEFGTPCGVACTLGKGWSRADNGCQGRSGRELRKEMHYMKMYKKPF